MHSLWFDLRMKRPTNLEAIKDIQTRLGDSNITLESFIVSNTPSHTMRMLWGIEKAQMESAHILFQDEDQDTYVESMLNSVFRDSITVAT